MREGIVAGLTTRNYRRAVQSVLEGYGIEKSSVSREFVAASTTQLQKLCERRLDELDLVALLIDGIDIGQHKCWWSRWASNISGKKHVLGLRQGATENTTVVKSLLEDLVARGLKQERRYLFVIDGAKALRAAIQKVFGERAEVQRCQIHKRRNVKDHLPKNCAERVRPADLQCLRDDALRRSQSGPGETLPATGTRESQCGTQPGGRARRDADDAPVRGRRAAATHAIVHQSYRVLSLDSGASDAKREALERGAINRCAGRPRACSKRRGNSGE